MALPLNHTMKELSSRFPVWFCDIWGVVHDGYKPFLPTTTALAEHRKNGGVVILVTNSPRTSMGVEKQLADIGVSHHSFDAIVTSGDVTRTLMLQQGGRKIYHLGPKRDYSIYEGLNIECVELADADSVLCTGLFDEVNEIPSDYNALLTSMKNQRLTMICANPDKVVRKGDKLIYCAGALAEQYQSLRGKVLMAGKPFTPIYTLAVLTAENILGKHLINDQILAIGDGPETDIKGATDFGLSCVLITGGINEEKDVAAHVMKVVPKAKILRAVPELDWA
jgi:HAD superfamily hydrolase (TIGR01459 family)